MVKNKLSHKIINYIDKNQKNIFEYLAKLISFKSVPGCEFEIQDFLKDDLAKLRGFDEVDHFAVDKEKKRPNNIGIKKGTGDGRDIIINGHIDVSPVAEESVKKWKGSPWKSAIRDGNIYGRGASDMKGGLVASIWAVKALSENNVNLRGNIFVEIVVGEEGAPSEPELGTLAVCERGYKAPMAIVPEPSSCEIFVEQSGVIGWDIFVPGKPTHPANSNLSSYPQRTGVKAGSESGVNALHKGIKIVNTLQELENQWVLRERKGVLGSGGIPNPDKEGVGMWNNIITALEAGNFNVWALTGHCKIRGLTLYPPWVRQKQVIDELWKAIKSTGTTDDWIREQINDKKLTFNPRLFRYWGPTQVPLDHDLVKILFSSYKDVTGKETTKSGAKFVSDATYLYLNGILPVIFGPGDLNYGAHGINEFVPANELMECTKTLALTLIDWCQLT